MDLFEEEQRIYDNAVNHIKAVDMGEPYNFEQFRTLTDEYCSLLKQLRRMTKLSDRTATGLNESNLELMGKVNYDTLTGIYNRRYMEEILEKDIRLLSRTEGYLSIMMLDVDFFKKYNDTYGHSSGDECLKAVAKTLAGCVMQPDDFAARYGGEEFVVALSNTSKSEACFIAEKILEAVRALGISHEKNEAAGCVTISIGVTTVKPKAGHNFADYIKKADAALYMSKNNGRNCYTFIDYEEDTE